VKDIIKKYNRCARCGTNYTLASENPICILCAMKDSTPENICEGCAENKLLAECQAYLMELEDKHPTSRYDKRKELIERIARLFNKGGE